uniref:Major sperm protein n=1 Tax=Globodera rostochiensis TaxID=31243 RepID=A0A914HRQ9_GLORO
MAQLPPEDIATMPAQKVVFNAPFDNKATYYVRIINPGTKRIGFAFKTTKPKRINMNPPNGVLGPKESVNVAISCDAFDPSSEDTKGDRVTVEWTNTPDPAATAFKLEWFQGDDDDAPPHYDQMQKIGPPSNPIYCLKSFSQQKRFVDAPIFFTYL